LGFGGLQKPWEIYILGILHGFVMGGISSYCRAFYGLLLPPGSEAAFYALYAVTDKGSSVIGPVLVGKIVDATGTIRLAFGLLAVLILLPAPLIWRIDAQRGRQDAIRMAAALKGKLGNHDDEDGDRQREDEEATGLLAVDVGFR